jgi:hypothetical protein
MEVLPAALSHITQAKASLIRAGIELQKCPVPIQHGCKLLRMVNDLDKIQDWLRSPEAESSEAAAVRGKPKRRTRLQKKLDQSHVAADKAIPDPPSTAVRDVLSSFTGKVG